MSEYRNMTRLACFVANDVTKYSRGTVQKMAKEWGWKVIDDFYEMYGNVYGADVDEIRGWIDEMAQEDE